MRTRFLSLLLVVALVPGMMWADNFVNLTPKPMQMTAADGELVLPDNFVVNCGGLSDEIRAEAQKFVADFNKATGYAATVATQADGALVNLALYEGSSQIGEEGYSLKVTLAGVTVAANAPAGFYYAFQSLKKILPTNVMAGVRDEAVTRYALPLVNITDKPRYDYRSFMLDVSRHFFSVEEVKRVLDVMAAYKMNRFHWHLSDDQGWRVEIKKWPRLTEVGSIAPNCRVADMEYGQYYWTNKPYGPHFYTQEQLRDVVAYAKERHIEIIPEIDMPGHFVAAMVSYPEFSCSPEAGRSIWVNGGISSDVLNVANPAAVDFTKDILAEIIDIFPHEYIHIGGDECPTSAWENNADCRRLKEELGLPNFRQLQSYFIKEVGGFIKEKGRKVAVWNEAITADGVDTKVVQDLDALVYCWIGADNAANKASQLGLKAVYTPQVPYYINRKQRPDDLNAGDGSDNLQRVYNVSPYNAAYGIQGTFWTEHVSEPEHLEYLALPRLIAIAESGWTPQNLRNFTDFQKRITADSTMLNYNNYHYNRDYMTVSASDEKVMPTKSTAEAPFYYRIVTRAGGDRANRCWELLSENSPLISQYSGKSAAAGKLWTNAQAAEGDANYDWQLWGVEESPEHPGKYALVCKAQPDGSLNPNPSAQSTSGRWTYDNSKKHYEFYLGESTYYGQADGVYYYAIRSSKVSGQYLNASLSGQGFAVNVYGNPADGNGGLFKFHPMTAEEETGDAYELLAEVKQVLRHAKTYEGAKQVGRYGAAETAALASLVGKANLGSMSAGEQQQFLEQLTAAFDAFRASFGYLEEGKTYRFVNAVEGYEGIALADNGKASYLTHTTDVWGNDAWEVTAGTVTNHTQSIKIKNVGTARLVGAAASSSTGNVGFPVAINKSGANVALTFNLVEDDFTLSSNGKNFYPVPEASATLPGIVSSGSNAGDQASNAFRPMGTGWHIEPVSVVTYHCTDVADGSSLGTYTRSVVEGTEQAQLAPEIKNYRVKEAKTEGNVVNVSYERISYSIVTEARDARGALLSRTEDIAPVDKEYTVSIPEFPYYNMVSADEQDGAVFTPTADRFISATYETNAYAGVKAAAGVVSELVAGRSYLIYDNSDANNGARRGFRTVQKSSLKINRVSKAEGATPYTPWTLEMSGTKFKVKNEYLGLYVPTFSKSENPVVKATGGAFSFTQNTDGSWKIQGTNSVCWDGNENGQMVGWDAPGHPHLVYEYFVQPYFEVEVKCVDAEGRTLEGGSKQLVVAGESFTLVAPSVKGYIVKTIENNEGLGELSDHTVVTITYEKEVPDGIEGVTSSAKAPSIYDLSGRKLSGISRPGIYIVNGQKVLAR